jgi:protein-S-isoprenylcysteine O-methyltransferase Ste14
MTYLAIFAVALLVALVIAAVVLFFDMMWEPIAVFFGVLAVVLFGLWGILYLTTAPKVPDATYPPPRIEFPTTPAETP